MRSSAILLTLLLAATQAASAQSFDGAPPPPGDGAEMAAAPGASRSMWTRDAAGPLNMAYRELGSAEMLGARGAYFDSAKSHYRSAIARYAKNDSSGAAAEARAASSLARAALAENPPPVAKDLPAPPKLDGNGAMRPGGNGPQGGRPPMGGPMRGPMGGGPGGGPGMWGGRGVDAAELGDLVKIDNTAETRSLADAAINANIASQKAAFAGNTEEAIRQRMLAASLASAVRDITAANHPELFQRPNHLSRQAQPASSSTKS